MRRDYPNSRPIERNIPIIEDYGTATWRCWQKACLVRVSRAEGPPLPCLCSWCPRAGAPIFIHRLRTGSGRWSWYV